MPFHDDEMLDEMQNIMLGRYSFDPAEQWDNISDEAKDFIRKCLSPKPEDRPTCREAMQHPWLNKTPATHEEALLHPNEALHNVHPDANLLPIVKQNFNARRRFRRVINTVRMLNRLNIGMSEYAQRMERVGFYGVNSGSFKSYSSDASDTSLRHANTFEFNSVGGTPAYHRTHDPSPLSNGTRGPEDVAERHHVRSKSGTRTLTLPL